MINVSQYDNVIYQALQHSHKKQRPKRRLKATVENWQ